MDLSANGEHARVVEYLCRPETQTIHHQVTLFARNLNCERAKILGNICEIGTIEICECRVIVWSMAPRTWQYCACKQAVSDEQVQTWTTHIVDAFKAPACDQDSAALQKPARYKLTTSRWNLWIALLHNENVTTSKGLQTFAWATRSGSSNQRRNSCSGSRSWGKNVILKALLL